MPQRVENGEGVRVELRIFHLFHYKQLKQCT